MNSDSHVCIECDAILPPGTAGAICNVCLFQDLSQPVHLVFCPQCQSRQEMIGNDETLSTLTCTTCDRSWNPEFEPSEPFTQSTITLVESHQLLEKIGEGGFSRVYRGWSLKLGRHLAIKVSKEKSGSAIEPRVLALLNHPNISKVVDTGFTQSGRLFVATELVDGPALTDYCNEHRLGINQRLSLFVDICRGLRHAHQQGVIHRDLKPANILVETQDGRPAPKIIDFGMAKVSDTANSLLMSTLEDSGRIMGTLRYMSPEHVNPDDKSVDTLADIYSLGVILFELLTGETPLDQAILAGQDIPQLLESIRTTTPTKPSEFLRQTKSDHASQNTKKSLKGRAIPPELDWIVLKAIDKDPDQRYQSASEFAEDIQRHLRNEAVLAGPPSNWYRFKKAIARNKAATALVCAVVVGSLTTAFGFYLAYINAKNEAIAKQAAVDNGIEAERQFERAFESVDVFYGKVSTDQRLKEAGLENLRKDLLELGKGYFETFVQERPSNLVTRRAFARSQFRLGGYNLQIGDEKSAVELLKDAEKMFGNILSDNPDSIQDGNDLCATILEISHFYFQQGNYAKSDQHIIQAVEIANRLLASNPKNAEMLAVLSSSNHQLARNCTKQGKQKQAVKKFNKAIMFREEVIEQTPDSLHDRQQLANSLNSLGYVYKEMGDPVMAIAFGSRTVKEYREMARLAPKDPEMQYELSSALYHLGNSFAESVTPEKASPLLKESVKIRESLCSRFPRQIKYRRGLARALGGLGYWLAVTGDNESANAIFRKESESFESLSNLEPENLNALMSLAQSRGNTAATLGEDVSQEEVLKLHRLALKDFRRLLAATPNDLDNQCHLGLALLNVGAKLANIEEYTQEAVSHLREAIEMFKELTRQSESPDYANNLARSLRTLAYALEFQDLEEAMTLSKEAVQVSKQLIERCPDVPEFKLDYVQSLRQYASVLQTKGNPELAIEVINTAIQCIREYPDSDPFQDELARFLQRYAELQMESNHEKAKTLILEATAILKSLQERTFSTSRQARIDSLDELMTEIQLAVPTSSSDEPAK